MEIYLVGGAVRDKLLNLAVKDRDWVVVGATANDMLDLGYRQVGRDFPVFLNPETGEEYALARTERKTGSGYTGFTMHASPGVSLEEDLQRRDLTINAMAEDGSGKVIDPCHGKQDIREKKLRHVSAAFTEDPLRVLRVARFAARFAHLGFTVAEETMELMASMVADGELQYLVEERVWQEMHLALTEKSPQAFFRVLRECNALAVILPEVEKLFGVPQPSRYHPEIDTGIHTMMVLKQATILSDDPQVRFAAFVHDVGKGVTNPERWPAHQNHETLGADLIMALCKRLKVPNDFRDLAQLVSLHHTACHRAEQHGAAQLLETLEKVDAFRRPQRFGKFLIACEADARGRKGLEQNPYPQASLLKKASIIASEVNIQDIIDAGYANSDIGIQLKKQRIAAIESRLSRND